MTDSRLTARPQISIQALGMHYGTFPVLTGRPDHLRALIQHLPGTEVLELKPGETLA